LRPVLADWKLPPADLYLVFPTKANLSAKTRVLVDFLHEWFKGHRDASAEMAGW